MKLVIIAEKWSHIIIRDLGFIPSDVDTKLIEQLIQEMGYSPKSVSWRLTDQQLNISYV